MSGQKTDYRFKLLYALGMIFVVAGHAGNGGVSFFYNWFPPYAFHLGLFAFASGYFYRRGSETQAGKFLWKKVRTLLLPMYAWNVFYGLLVALLRRWGFDLLWPQHITLKSLLLLPLTSGHQFGLNLGGWFVAPLFMLHVWNVLTRKGFRAVFGENYSEWLVYAVDLILGLAGIWLSAKGYYKGYWVVLSRLTYFLPFYALGGLYKEKLEKHDTLPNVWYFAIVLLCQLIVIYRHGWAVSYTPAWCDDFTDGPFLPVIVGYLGIAFWLRAARLLEPSIGRSRIVTAIADNTYAIMLHQFLGFMAVKTGYALLNHFLGVCEGFDWVAYKTDLWYYYAPHDIYEAYILYLLAGLFLPLLIQKGVELVKTAAARRLPKKMKA